MRLSDVKKRLGANDADALRAITVGSALSKILNDEPSPVAGMAMALALGDYLRKLPNTDAQEKHLDWLLMTVAKVLANAQ